MFSNYVIFDYAITEPTQKAANAIYSTMPLIKGRDKNCKLATARCATYVS